MRDKAVGGRVDLPERHAAPADPDKAAAHVDIVAELVRRPYRDRGEERPGPRIDALDDERVPVSDPDRPLAGRDVLRGAAEGDAGGDGIGGGVDLEELAADRAGDPDEAIATTPEPTAGSVMRA
jgi:hypothetical protein